MSTRLTRYAILQKTVQVGASTLISRLLGSVRELLMIGYLGVGPLADAFIAAFRIPNSLRRIFGEGALTAAFVPTLVTVLNKDGQKAANRLITITFIIIETFLLLLCLLLVWQAPRVIAWSLPGWSSGNLVLVTASLLKILIFYILFVSSIILLAGALQAVHHFTIPAISQVITNIIFIIQIIICQYYNLPITYLAYGILLNGFIIFLMHIFAARRNNFIFIMPDRAGFREFGTVLGKFFPPLISMGAVEINLFIDQMLASYLPAGSVSLLYYAQALMRVPLSVFATAFSTIVLGHFARVHAYAPKRFNFYVLESAKLVFWVMTPISLLMAIFSYKLFYTISLISTQFPVQYVDQAAQLLIAFALGLFFFSLNKILLNIFYAMHETFIPTVVSLGTTVLNTLFNLLLMYFFGVLGLVVATVLAELVKTFLFLIILALKFSIKLYWYRFILFVRNYIVQLLVAGVIFYSIYKIIELFFTRFSNETLANFFLFHIGYWLWVGPLCGLLMLFLYFTRKQFAVRSYFLD